MERPTEAIAGDDLRLFLLGSFRVVVGEREVEPGGWRLRKAQSLVKLLTLTSGRRLHREQVMDTLWPDLTPEAAGNNLHQALYAARRALDRSQSPHAGSQFLRLETGVLALRPPGRLWVDVEAFQAAAGRCRGSRDPRLFQTAIDCYGGDLLPDDRYEAWVTVPAADLRAAYLRLLETYAQVLEEREEYEEAIGVLHRLVASEPVHEEAQLDLVRLYARTGQRRQALGQYEHLRTALRRDLDAEPSAASQRLYQVILAGGTLPVARPVDGQPAVTPLAQRTRHLPRPLTSFIGRQREVNEVRRLVGTARLVTITGAGGCGKTRLALEVATALGRDYADGVWFVELDALRDPDLIPQAVAVALGVREVPGRATTRLLSAHLAARHLLLVLDNCEHLVAACARLVELLLRGSESLQILATSREPLRVGGEVTLGLPPLALAAADAPAGAPNVQSEAVTLFLARARDRQPGLAPTAQNVLAAADICSRLDGIPLAIELAAALVPVIPIQRIAERLDDALRLLSQGSRTVPRHETLRSTLDWSYALLTERQRLLFRRLAVFAGSFDLPAVEAVCAGDDLDRADVLPLLAALAEKSMVVARGDGGETRYRLLEMVRQCARELLEAVEEGEYLQRRHAHYFLELVEQAEPKVLSAERAPWLVRLDAEQDNLRAALGWGLWRAPRHDVELGLRLAGGLLWYWNFQGRVGEGRRWLEAALSRSSDAPVAARAKILYAAGECAWLFGEYEAARARLEESAGIWRDLGNNRALAFALQALAGAIDPQTDPLGASAAASESLRLFRDLGDAWGVAVAVHSWGIAELRKTDFAGARARFEDALARYRELGDDWGCAQVLNGLGDVARGEGDHARAGALYAESLAIFRSQGLLVYTPSVLHNLGYVALGQGDARKATQLFQEGVELFRDQADQRGVAECLAGLAGAVGALRQPRDAAWLFGSAEAVLRASGAAMWPSNLAEYERNVAIAREQLDEQAFAEAWAEGRTSSLDQAIAHALQAARRARA